MRANESLILKCARTISEEENLEAAIKKVLSMVGTYCNAKRTYIVQAATDRKIEKIYEWCAPGIEGITGYIEEMGFYNYDVWREALDNNTLIKGIGEEIKEINPAEHEAMRKYHINSYVVFPFAYKGERIGYIGADDMPDYFDDEFLKTVFFTVSNAVVERIIQEELEKKDRDLRIITNSISAGLGKVLMDENMTLLYGNIRLYEICGYTEEEFEEIGNSLKKIIIPEDYERTQKEIEAALERGQRNITFEQRIRKKNGDIIWAETSIVFMEEEGVNIQNSVTMDITERKKTEKALKLSEKGFDMVMEHTVKAIFKYNFEEHTMERYGEKKINATINQTITDMPEAILDLSILYMPDRERLYNMAVDAANGKLEGSCEVQVKSYEGGLIWVKVSYHTIADEQGTPLMAIVAAEDINERKILEEAYHREEHYRTMIMGEVASFFDVNLTKNLLVYALGKAADRLYNRDYTEVLNTICDNEIHADDEAEYRRNFSRESLLADFEMGISEFTSEFRSRLLDERFIWSEAVVHMAREPVTGDIKAFIYVKDVDKSKRERIDLQKKAQRDELTGLYNRTFARSEIENYIGGSHGGSTSALFLVNIENLQKILETYGHHYKDKILSDIGEYISTTLRADDVIGSFGSDRFIIFVKNLSSISIATEKAKNICDYIEHSYRDEMKVWCSVGICIYPNDGANFEELNKKAEIAIYEAMRQGKNRYAFYNRSQKGAYSTKEVMLEKREEKATKAKKRAIRRDRIRNALISTKGIIAVYGMLAIVAALVFSKNIKEFYNGYSQTPLIFIAVLSIAIFVVPAAIIGSYAWYRRNLARDEVTGRNNKHSFEAEVEKLIRNDNHTQYEMIFANINMFTLVNDQYGSKRGDEVLRSIHAIIDENLQADETSGRLRADKFGILMKADDNEAIEERLEEISDTVERLCDDDGISYSLKLSYGIYMIEDITMDVSAMIDYASIALDLISKTSKVAYGVYDTKYKQQKMRERTMENRMRAALSHKDFEVFLQPKYRLADDSLASAEALVRWHDEAEGLIMPDQFIPLFERNGFIVQLDLYMFEEVCKIIQKWVRAGVKPIPVAINLSRQNLDIPDFLSVYKKLLDDYNIPANLVEFEFTETVVHDRADILEQIVEEIHDMGCLCAMDDFGSGYSSLNMLQNISVDVLKMDCAFFTDNGREGGKHKKLIMSIISMAKALNLETVAEGIETWEQVEYLREMGCDYVQGFVYAPPMPLCEFEQLKYGKSI